MVEIDANARRGNNFWKNQGISTVPFLLTQERTQALDILVHLVTNTSESILFCGPEGVGKTTLLEVLQSYEIPGREFCFIKARNDLTLDALKEQLGRVLKNNQLRKNDRKFANSHDEKTAPSPKTILIIDDSGELMPGLCTEILQYADNKTYISVVFVLTHDQLQLKLSSDQAVEKCHIVELPPLTEKQCGEFVQHISNQTANGMKMNALSEHMVAEIYQQSHGLPSRLIARYSAVPQKKEENPARLLVMAVIGLIVFAFAVQWYSSRQIIAVSEITADKPANYAEINLEQIFLSLPITEPVKVFQSDYLLLNEVEKPPQWNTPLAKITFIDTAQSFEITSRSAIEPNEKTDPNQNANSRSNLKKREAPEDDYMRPDEETSLNVSDADLDSEIENSKWLLAQPANSYTLQLMVLSKQQSIFDVMEKYPSLRKNLRFCKRLIQNKEKYVLFYGSFPDAASAKKVKQGLPEEFRKSITRKISEIRKEFK